MTQPCHDDSHADALALYRAYLDGDQEGVSAVISGIEDAGPRHLGAVITAILDLITEHLEDCGTGPQAWAREQQAAMLTHSAG
jgi:hypothetical protein